MRMGMTRITTAELDEIVAASLPWVADLGLRVEELGAGQCRARLPFTERIVRPGGTVAGPMLVALASFAAYAAVLSLAGRVETAAAVNLGVNFFQSAAGDVLAEARVPNAGKRLIFTETRLLDAEAPDRLLAHVTATFSLPRGAGSLR